MSLFYKKHYSAFVFMIVREVSRKGLALMFLIKEKYIMNMQCQKYTLNLPPVQ